MNEWMICLFLFSNIQSLVKTFYKLQVNNIIPVNTTYNRLQITQRVKMGKTTTYGMLEKYPAEISSMQEWKRPWSWQCVATKILICSNVGKTGKNSNSKKFRRVTAKCKYTLKLHRKEAFKKANPWKCCNKGKSTKNPARILTFFYVTAF